MATPPRPRGRPRKTSAPEASAATPEISAAPPEVETAPAPVKRGPGRPRKMPVADGTATAATAKAIKTKTPRKPAQEAAKPAETKSVNAPVSSKPVPPRRTRSASTSAPKRSTVARLSPATESLKTAARKAKTLAAAIPVPETTPRQRAGIAAAFGGAVAAVGAAVLLWRATKSDQPDYKLIESDGSFEIRDYPAIVVAETVNHGPRDVSLNRGFDTLANYIFAKSRPGEKISMTAPVLADKTASNGWRTRFIMPGGVARGDLPGAPAGVELKTERPRRVATIRFSGRADDRLLDEREGALRSWLQLRRLPSEATAEHAFYNSPMIPGPLRRNEILMTLSED